MTTKAKTKTIEEKPIDHRDMAQGSPKPTSARDLVGHTFTREIAINEIRAVNEDDRTIEIAFSSDATIDRFWYQEILDHNTSSVRMERLNSGRAAVLMDHNHQDQVGVVSGATVDKDGKGRATVRMSRSARGQEIFNDIQDGIRGLVSVGYRIHDAVLERTGDDGDTYRITDWEPYEVSFVSVPADASVGVGRNLTFNNHEESNMKKKVPEAPDQERDLNTPPVDERGEDDTATDLETQPTEDSAREMINKQIRNLAGMYKRSVPSAETLAEQVIGIDGSLDDMKRELRNAFAARKPVPVPAAPAAAERVEMKMVQRTKQLKAFTNTREGLEDAYRAGMWARATLFGDQNAQRWCKDYGVRVMTTADFSAGGAVVPEEMSQAIIDLREQYGIARQQCYVHPMGSDSTTIPRRKSGVTAYFVGEEDATTASDKSWDQIQLNAREVSALTRISMAYAEDAVIDVADDLAGEMAYAFAVKEDECLFNGDGTSTYGGIFGIRPKIIDGTHTAGAIDAATGHDTFAEIDADDLLSVSGALPEYPGIVAKWYSSKRAKNLVFDALKAAAGGNTVITLEGQPRKDWLGDEIVVSQAMPKVTTALDNVAMLVHGDLRMGATFGDRRGFAVQILRERYAEYRQIGIIAWERFDINVHGLGDTSNAGPIVALIGKTS